jgi:acetyl esterase/lipase
MRIPVITWLCLISLTTMAQKVISLYNDKIPNSIDSPDEETENRDGWPLYLNVSRPTLKIFLPQKVKANGTAVIICPGGGYSVIAYQHEGEAMAEELSKVGVTAFVVKYRIPNTKYMINKTIGPLQDAQQAIKLVRKNAKTWNIDPNKVGIAGFSAGGHLASTAGTHYDKQAINNKEKINLRPDFMILAYPVISFTDSIGHLGSRENLLGKTPSADLVKLYSNELQVNANTPPAFIVHAIDDNVVKVANSTHFYEALLKNKVPAEIFLFEKGNHGFGLINLTTSERWLDRCKVWMKKNGLL